MATLKNEVVLIKNGAMGEMYVQVSHNYLEGRLKSNKYGNL